LAVPQKRRFTLVGDADRRQMIGADLRLGQSPGYNLGHVIRWWVTTVRQNGVDDQGEAVYISAGTSSEERVFSWTGVAVEGTPGP
jgi:hypothetical protein